jgi:hypothetical protein
MSHAENGPGDEAQAVHSGKDNRVLRQAEAELVQGKRVREACRGLGISEQSYYRWCSENGGLNHK